jgi:hypothetical protein
MAARVLSHRRKSKTRGKCLKKDKKENIKLPFTEYQGYGA